MKMVIRAKKKARAPRRPKRSASLGMARQPRIVAQATNMVAKEASRAAAGPTRPVASARAVTAAGTYTVPAHRPQIETIINSEFRMVRRRSAGVKSAASGRHQDQVGRIFSF